MTHQAVRKQLVLFIINTNGTLVFLLPLRLWDPGEPQASWTQFSNIPLSKNASLVHPFCRTWYGICHCRTPVLHHPHPDKVSGGCCCICVLLADHQLPVEKPRNKPLVLHAPEPNIWTWKSNLSFLPRSNRTELVWKPLTCQGERSKPFPWADSFRMDCDKPEKPAASLFTLELHI